MISCDATFSHKIVISFEWQKIQHHFEILWLDFYQYFIQSQKVTKGYERILGIQALELDIFKFFRDSEERKSISYISDWTCSTIL